MWRARRVTRGHFRRAVRAAILIGPCVAGLASLLFLAACGGTTTTGRRNMTGGVTEGAAVGANGTIYVASDAGILHAIDPATGKDRWTSDAHATARTDLSVSPLVLPDGTNLYPTPAVKLVALSAGGHLVWTQPLPGRPTSPVTANGTRVYAGDDSGGVSAIDIHRLARRSARWPGRGVARPGPGRHRGPCSSSLSLAGNARPPQRSMPDRCRAGPAASRSRRSLSAAARGRGRPSLRTQSSEPLAWPRAGGH